MSASVRARLRPLVAVLTLAVLLFTAMPARACPLCSEDAENTQKDTGVNVAMGYTVSVLFMIIVPVTVAAGLGYLLYRNSHTEAEFLARLESSRADDQTVTGDDVAS